MFKKEINQPRENSFLVFCVSGIDAQEKIEEIMYEIKHSHSQTSSFLSSIHKHELERAFWFGG